MALFNPGDKVTLLGEVVNTYDSDSSMTVRLADGQAIHTQQSNGVAVIVEAAKPAEAVAAETKPEEAPSADVKTERRRTQK